MILVLVLVGIGLYALVAAIGNASGTTALHHARSIVAWEVELGFAWESTVREWFDDSPGAFTFFEVFYASTYWPVLVGVPWWCWRRDRRQFRLMRNAMLLSGLTGLIVFAVYPVAPPRLLPEFQPVPTSNSLMEAVAHPSLLGNPYAALPSFHVGWWALVLGIAAVVVRRRWAALVALGLTVLMIVAVLVTANHYMIDVVAGLGLCGLSAAAALAWQVLAPLGQEPQYDDAERWEEPVSTDEEALEPACRRAPTLLPIPARRTASTPAKATARAVT